MLDRAVSEGPGDPGLRVSFRRCGAGGRWGPSM